MRRLGARLSLIACLAMISLQAIGVHLHVDALDHDRAIDHHEHHEHAIASHYFNDDHDGHLDISVFDAAAKVSNSAMFVALPNPVYEFVTTLSTARWILPVSIAPPNPHYRQRPPLRAPPVNA